MFKGNSIQCLKAHRICCWNFVSYFCNNTTEKFHDTIKISTFKHIKLGVILIFILIGEKCLYKPTAEDFWLDVATSLNQMPTAHKQQFFACCFCLTLFDRVRRLISGGLIHCSINIQYSATINSKGILNAIERILPAQG